MKIPLRMASALVSFAGLAALAVARADAAELYAIVANGQGILGTVPAHDPIRIRFPLSKNASPTLSLNLLGSGAITVSFKPAKVYGPDGKEIVFDTDYFSIRPHVNAGGGRDGIVFKGWRAPESGFYEIVIETNARTSLRASGKFTVSRLTRFAFAGDENSPPEVNPVVVPMQGDLSTGVYDQISLTVRRVTGAPPFIASAKRPSGIPLFVSQKKTTRGSTTSYVASTEFGDYAFTIGYQPSIKFPTPAGKWRGVVTIKPFKGGYPATLALRNPPGVPLSVLDADRVMTIPFGGTHAGVASDGTLVLATSEANGSLYGELFDQELSPPTTPNVVTMTGPLDLAVGETVSGHRVLYMGGAYFAAFSTASGQSVVATKFNLALQRGSVQPVVANAADATTDFFLTGDGPHVAIGVPHATSASHTVYQFDALNFGNPTTIAIGGAFYPQAPGGGAAWRGTDAVFELWTPDTLDYRGPSKLHRVLYSAAWNPSTADARLTFADPSPTDTMPTAVSVDPQTGVTIVHYVAADGQPQGPLGSGNVHRRLFDATGVEIPGSHAILPRTACNRPSSQIVGNRIFLAYETPSGPVLERYPLLRTN